MGRYAFLICTILAPLAQAQTVNCTTMFGPVFNQTTCSKPPDYVSPIIDAMKASADAQMKARQLQLEKEQLDLQKEQLRLKQKKQSGAEKDHEQVSTQQSQTAQVQIDLLLQSLRNRYPDFSQYELKIAELANSFLPGKNVSAYDYVEGLYLIAKHAAQAKHEQ